METSVKLNWRVFFPLLALEGSKKKKKGENQNIRKKLGYEYLWHFHHPVLNAQHKLQFFE